MSCTHVRITGKVQGVSYRAWTQRTARGLGLTGWARNRADGSVEAVFCGAPETVSAMLRRCQDGPRNARVEAVETLEEAEAPGPGFEIRPTA